MESGRFNKLFVGGFSMEITEDALKEHFSNYGEVEESIIISDKNTGLSKRFGFITFTNSSMAAKALQEEHLILGRKVDVSYARSKVNRNQEQRNEVMNEDRSNCSKNNSSKNKIFVGGLHPHLKNADLKAYFENYGRTEDAFVVVNKENGRSRGFGFVTLESEETFETVLRVKSHELKGKHVEVKRADPRVLPPPHTTKEPSNSPLSFKFCKDVYNTYSLPPCWSSCAIGFYYLWYYPYLYPVYYGDAPVHGYNIQVYDDSSVGSSQWGSNHYNAGPADGY
ncbi:hypothetical protein SLA2020_470900 [Shorea laevis]